MATSLPSTTLRRASTRIQSPTCCCTHTQQTRHASLLKRPHRPYQFTQLVTLSDGSTYMHRTTSPAPTHTSTKDTRNHAVWQPSLSSLRNIEQDEAGRLRAFRDRFGRAYDLDSETSAVPSTPSKSSSKADVVIEGGGEGGKLGGGVDGGKDTEQEWKPVQAGFDDKDDGDSLMDLISGGYGRSRDEDNKYTYTRGGKRILKRGKGGGGEGREGDK